MPPFLSLHLPKCTPQIHSIVKYSSFRKNLSTLLRNYLKYLMRNVHIGYSLLPYGYKLVIFTVMSNILFCCRNSVPAKNSHQDLLIVSYAVSRSASHMVLDKSASSGNPVSTTVLAESSIKLYCFSPENCGLPRIFSCTYEPHNLHPVLETLCSPPGLVRYPCTSIYHH